MKVEFYEKIWLCAASALLALFVGTILVTAASDAVLPPTHMETVDPTALANHPEFGSPGVKAGPDGGIVVSVVAQTFSFFPDPIEVPTHRPVTFRITSSDVLHGFQIVGTNANAMAIPGYVSQFTVTFNKPGEYPIACNEYCGLMHHGMVAKLLVKEESR